MLEHTSKNHRLISSFVHQTLREKEQEYVKALIENAGPYRDLYLEKVSQRDTLKAIIPKKRMSRESKKLLLSEIADINKENLNEGMFPTFKKIYKFLTSPIVEF